MLQWMLDLGTFLLGYTGVFGAFAGITAWELITKQALPRDIKWAIYLIAVLADSFRNSRTAKIERKAPVSGPRVFAEQPELVLAHIRNPRTLTYMQVVQCLHQWITVSGRIEAISESLAQDAILVALTLDNGQRVNLRFARAAADGLKKDQAITAACQIQYPNRQLALANCEVLRVRTPTLALVS